MYAVCLEIRLVGFSVFRVCFLEKLEGGRMEFPDHMDIGGAERWTKYTRAGVMRSRRAVPWCHDGWLPVDDVIGGQ